MRNWLNKNFKKKISQRLTKKLVFHIPALKVVWGVFGGLFAYAFSKLMIIKPEGVYIGQPNSWSDWVVHISITNIFATKPINEWFLYHPFFAYGKLTYGFLSHLLTALIMKLGFRIDVAFFIMSIILLFTFLTGLYFLYYQISDSRKKSLLGIFIFFTSSGMGIFRYLNKLKINDLLHPAQDFTKFIQYDWLAGNIPAAMIIPQRAFFIGVTIGVWVLNLLLLGLEKKEKTNFVLTRWYQMLFDKKIKNKLNQQQKLFLTAGLLAGILPIAHMHSFIAIVIITGTICLFHMSPWIKKPKSKAVAIQKLKQLFFFIVPAGIISTILYFSFIHGGIEVDNFMTVSLGWTATQNLAINATLLTKIGAWIKMWLQLWGTFLPLVIFAFYYLKKNKQLKKYLATFSGFILIFILANIIVFQPTAWDNTKLFAWVYLGLSILLAQLIFELWHKSKELKILTIILLITLSFSGSVELIRIFNFKQNTYLLSSTQEINLAQKIADNTKTDAVFLTSTKHNHPIPLWANRPIFLGYLGWVKNFGFDPTVRIQEVHSIFSGQTNANKIIIKNKISYIYVGPLEKREFIVNYNYLSQFPVAFENENTIVYDTRQLWQ